MKTVEFTYTDAKGKTTSRSLLALISPSIAYEGIDVSEMSTDEYMSFLTKCKKLQDEYITAIQAIQAEYDLAHNYRRFLVERMTDIRVT